jgi:hypothetical protein
MTKVAIAITTYRKPERLAGLLDNMWWSGVPDVPIFVFEDPSFVKEERAEITEQFRKVCKEKGNLPLYTAPKWGCMQGIIDYAFKAIHAEWIIYVPDDVRFPRGALWNEYAGILTYGRDFVGGIQAPFWNADDLVTMGVMPSKDAMFNGWQPLNVPRNPHWEGGGIPRKYINLNGAGFSLNRELYEAMGGWPECTWRLDEWAGYQAWRHGMVIITLPGPPRVHYFGGATDYMPKDRPDFSSIEAWIEATGKIPSETGVDTVRIMNKLEEDNWDYILDFFHRGGRLV